MEWTVSVGEGVVSVDAGKRATADEARRKDGGEKGKRETREEKTADGLDSKKESACPFVGTSVTCSTISAMKGGKKPPWLLRQ